MDVVGGIVTYIMIWWVVFFAILPFGVRQAEISDPAHAVGAPANPRVLFKMLIASLISFLLWFGVDQLFRSGLISLGANFY